MLGTGQGQIQCTHELTHLDGLGQVIEQPGGKPFFDVVRHGVGTDRIDGNPRRERICAQNAQRLHPADSRQIDIHEYHVWLESMAIIEKLALLRMAFCSAPALISSVRRCTSTYAAAFSGTRAAMAPITLLDMSYPGEATRYLGGAVAARSVRYHT